MESAVAATPEVHDRCGYLVSRMYLRGKFKCKGHGKEFSFGDGVVIFVNLEKTIRVYAYILRSCLAVP